MDTPTPLSIAEAKNQYENALGRARAAFHVLQQHEAAKAAEHQRQTGTCARCEKARGHDDTRVVELRLRSASTSQIFDGSVRMICVKCGRELEKFLRSPTRRRSPTRKRRQKLNWGRFDEAPRRRSRSSASSRKRKAKRPK